MVTGVMGNAQRGPPALYPAECSEVRRLISQLPHEPVW